MAAVYMQRHWKSRLGLYLDDMILLPDLFPGRWACPRRRSVSARRDCTGWLAWQTFCPPSTRLDEPEAHAAGPPLGRELGGSLRGLAESLLVYEGFRQQTLDMANDDHGAIVAAVRELKETLSLNIVEVSPSDFIPLPSGYSERSQYIGR